MLLKKLLNPKAATYDKLLDISRRMKSSHLELHSKENTSIFNPVLSTEPVAQADFHFGLRFEFDFEHGELNDFAVLLNNMLKKQKSGFTAWYTDATQKVITFTKTDQGPFTMRELDSTIGQVKREMNKLPTQAVLGEELTAALREKLGMEAEALPTEKGLMLRLPKGQDWKPLMKKLEVGGGVVNTSPHILILNQDETIKLFGKTFYYRTPALEKKF